MLMLLNMSIGLRKQCKLCHLRLHLQRHPQLASKNDQTKSRKVFNAQKMLELSVARMQSKGLTRGKLTLKFFTRGRAHHSVVARFCPRIGLSLLLIVVEPKRMESR